MSMMVSFVLSFFPRDVLDEILNLIESVSEDFPSYSLIEAFNSTSQYLDDLLNINNNFFASMVNRIYPSELQLNKATCQIPRPHFRIYIYLYRMVLSRLKSMINKTIWILIL